MATNVERLEILKRIEVVVEALLLGVYDSLVRWGMIALNVKHGFLCRQLSLLGNGSLFAKG